MRILESFDGSKIGVYEHFDSKEPKGIIQLACAAGGGEKEFTRFAKYLNLRGYMAVACTLRGFGAVGNDAAAQNDADGENINCTGGPADGGNIYPDTVKDLAFIAKHYTQMFAGMKYFLAGYGYGGSLVQSFIYRYPRFLDGAVIAPGVKSGTIAARVLGAVSFLAGKIKGENAPAKILQGLYLSGAQNDRINEGEHANGGALCIPAASSYGFFTGYFRGVNSVYGKKAAGILDEGLPLLIALDSAAAVKEQKRVKNVAEFYKKQNICRVQLKSFSEHNGSVAEGFAHLVEEFCDSCKLRNKNPSS